ncbi:MAG: DUF4177 domain-containing protein [Desulfobulbaceae bacterium]|jgi:hypothetical protein|nr:DUF4177 domain-containing protein [Desulfobulbaceae bacterium]
MIRWRYKTLHIDLKKDGLLGGSFLDEPELEQILCRYGQDGWELVTMLDVQDGLVALCKQPLDERLPEMTDMAASVAPSSDEAAPVCSGRPLIITKASAASVVAPLAASEPVERPPSLFGETTDEEATLDGPRINTETDSDDDNDGLISIKIE